MKGAGGGPFFVYWCEKSDGGVFRGEDGLLQGSAGTFLYSRRPPWLTGPKSHSTYQQRPRSLYGLGAKQEQVIQLVRGMWTEVRVVLVLWSIWGARCDLLHDNVATKEAAATQAFSRVRSTLRAIAYRKLPSLLPGAHHPANTCVQQFYKLTWGATAEPLLLPRRPPIGL